jgi:hypothetical protein
VGNIENFSIFVQKHTKKITISFKITNVIKISHLYILTIIHFCVRNEIIHMAKKITFSFDLTLQIRSYPHTGDYR